MDNLWLQDEYGNKLILDNRVINMNIGTLKRDYTVEEFAGAAGGQIKGFGKIKSRKLSVKVIDFVANTTEDNFFNSSRDSFLIYMTKARYINMWLYMNRADGKTVRALCYVQEIGGNNFSSVKYSDPTEFVILLPKGLYENVSPSTQTKTIIDSSEHTLIFTNNGLYNCPGRFKFTPTANETSFRVELADQFGFILQGSFLAGKEIVYNTGNNILTINGLYVPLKQYLTGGYLFNLPVGNVELVIQCSGAGNFELEYNERFI